MVDSDGQSFEAFSIMPESCLELLILTIFLVQDVLKLDPFRQLWRADFYHVWLMVTRTSKVGRRRSFVVASSWKNKEDML